MKIVLKILLFYIITPFYYHIYFHFLLSKFIEHHHAELLPLSIRVPMIVGEIRRYLRDNSAIRVSRSMRDTAYRVLQAREQLMSQNQREPTVEQIAAHLGIPREEVVMAMDAIVDPVSLYEPVYSDAGDNVCVMDQVRDSNNSDEHWLEQISLKDAIARLDKRQRNILALRFCQGKTQMEVSSEIGISQAQVSRLEKSAIACIKREM